MTDQEAIDQGYLEGQKSFEYMARTIIQNFDFEKVYKVMKLLDWGWRVGASCEELYIPTIQALKRRALIYLKEVFDDKRTMSTGGFTYGYDNGDLYLTFTIEEWHSGDC